MKNMDEIIKILRENKEEFEEKYKIKGIKIFDSYARGGGDKRYRPYCRF